MNDLIVGLIGAILGSGLIQFLIKRSDEKKANPIEAKIDKILEEQKRSEKDNLRTQLLVMMNLMSDNKEEIMTCAERYFKQLKGDWFYSSLFKKWLKDNDVEPPIWFIEK